MLTKSINKIILSRSIGRQFSKLQKFKFEDPLNFDALLTDEEKMVQESAR